MWHCDLQLFVSLSLLSFTNTPVKQTGSFIFIKFGIPLTTISNRDRRIKSLFLKERKFNIKSVACKYVKWTYKGQLLFTNMNVCI